MSAPRLTGEQKLAILRDFKAGAPLADIAAKFGVDQSYPRILARRRGLPPRGKMMTPYEAPTRVCAACFRINHISRKTCEGCGETFTRQTAK